MGKKEVLSGQEKLSEKPVVVRRSFATDFFSTFGASVMGFLLSIITSILIARAVGPKGKGILALVFLASGQAASFLSLGVESALIYYVGSGQVKKQSASSTSFLLSLGLGVLAAGFMVGVLHFVLKEGSFPIWALIYLSALLLPLTIYSRYLEVIGRAEGRIAELAGLSLIERVLQPLLILLCYLFFRSVPAILAVSILSSLISTAVSFVFYAKWGYFPPRLFFSNKLVAKRLVSYGLKGHVGTVFQSLNYRLDMYIVALFLSAAQVGIYSVAVRFSEILWIIPNALGIVIAQRAASRSWEEVNRITASVTRLTLAIMAISCVAWAFLGKMLIPLFYGQAFSEAVDALLWLLPGTLLLGLWKNLLNDVVSRGYPLLKTLSSGAGVGATILFDLLLIPKYGIEGAAVASSIAYAIATLTVIIPYCKITKIQPTDLFLLRREDVAYVKNSFALALSLVRGARA